METITHHEITTAFIARIFLGLLFFFQGYDAVFNVKIRNVIQTYEDSFASIAFGISTPMWDTRHVFPRLLLLLLLLIIPASWNVISLDNLFTYFYK